jgi:hypothetical protein
MARETLSWKVVSRKYRREPFDHPTQRYASPCAEVCSTPVMASTTITAGT